jgi:hypothetical protein
VTISGVGLLGGDTAITSVLLDGVEVTQIVSSNNSAIVVIAARSSASNVSGAVRISADTGFFFELPSAFQYLDEGIVVAVEPSTGQLGTRVVITGTDLRGSGDRVVAVTLANVPTALVNESNTVVHVVATEGSAGSGDVVLISESGATVTKANGWTYLPRGNVTAVSPNSGQHGTVVSISGTNLLAGATTFVDVKLAGVSVDTISFANDTLVVVPS